MDRHGMGRRWSRPGNGNICAARIGKLKRTFRIFTARPGSALFFGCAVASLLAGMCLGTATGQAQDATWLLNPGTNDWNTAANWGPAAVPTGTATFDASNTTALDISSNATIGALQFNVGAPAYTFSINGALTNFTINGSGIINSSANAPSFINSGLLVF